MTNSQKIIEYLKTQNQTVVSKLGEKYDIFGNVHYFDIAHNQYYRVMTCDMCYVQTFKDEDAYLELIKGYLDAYHPEDTVEDVKAKVEKIKATHEGMYTDPEYYAERFKYSN